MRAPYRPMISPRSRRSTFRLVGFWWVASLLIASNMVLPAVGQDSAAPSLVARPTPTPAQKRFQDLELGLFFHFGINSAYGVQASDGTLDPLRFEPSALDANAWVELAKRAGARYVILTAKHRDGFCLWPTATTDYSVKATSWRGGEGDVIQDVAEACARAGLGFGVYLASWDRHEPTYSDAAAYTAFFSRQLEELLAGYGPLVEIWLDGASPDGRAYDWGDAMRLIRQHQPDAMIFNMGEPTVRWCGNDVGLAPEPCWNVAKRADIPSFSEGTVLSEGDGDIWLPVEGHVPLRGGWFWDPRDTESLKSLERLLVLYYRSVGRGANLLLGVAPDKSGRIPEPDRRRLLDFGTVLRERFENPLGSTQGEAKELELVLPRKQAVDHVVLQEKLTLGERVRRYTVEVRSDAEWNVVAAGLGMGHKQIHWFEPVETTKLRLRVTESSATPHIRQLAAYQVCSGRAAELYASAKTGDEGVEERLRSLDLAVQRLPAFGPFHVFRGFARKTRGEFDGALSDFDMALDLEPNLISLRHVRAEIHFRHRRFEDAVEDYNAAAVLGTPHDESSCWERGLAYYYLGRFREGAEQFERYHEVGALDIENGLWRLLCMAQVSGLEAARKDILEYRDRVRPPFPALLDLYLGKGSAEAVIEQATRDVLRRDERRHNLFYGHYYLAKYYELVGARKKALESVREALQYDGGHFMYVCAEIDRERLEKSPDNSPEKSTEKSAEK
jgi:alpha-L-fucosidase